MFAGFTFVSSVLNLIYLKQLKFYYTLPQVVNYR